MLTLLRVNSKAIEHSIFLESKLKEVSQWNQILHAVHGEIGTRWNRFSDLSLESQFANEMKEVSVFSTRRHLLITAVVHAVFYGSLFSVIEYSSPVEVLTNGVEFCVMVMVHTFLWVWVKWRGAEVTTFCMHLSLILDSIGILYIAAVVKSSFTMLGLIMLVVSCENTMLPQTFFMYSSIFIVIKIGFLIFQDELHFFEVIPWFAPPMFTLVVMTFYRHLHCHTSRAIWKLGIKLREDNFHMENLLLDLMPSSEARKFMLTRYIRIGTWCNNSSLSFKLDTNPVVCCLDSTSLACVLSSDLVGFTSLCAGLRAQQVVMFLHDLWCIMDSVVIKHQSNSLDVLQISNGSDASYALNLRPFKMDTIGDAYVIVLKLPDSVKVTKTKAVSELMLMASDIMNDVEVYSQTLAPESIGVDSGNINMRMGLALGEAISGVIGYLQPRYHVYGEAIRKAALLESQSYVGCLKVCNSSMSVLPTALKDSSVFSMIASSDSPNVYFDPAKFRQY